MDNIQELVEHGVKERIFQLNRPYRLTDAQFKQVESGFTLEHQGLLSFGETPLQCAENFDKLWTFGP